MRWIALAAVVVLLGCGSDAAPADARQFCTFEGRTYPVGAQFPSGCNGCMCTRELGVECTAVACPDANPAEICAPAGACPGPTCAGSCCGVGERCEAGQCRCGAGSTCATPGDTCEAAGPIGTDRCGSVCCGVSGPCPQ